MPRIRLLPVEKATYIYIAATTLYLGIFFQKLDSPWIHFGVRILVSTLILVLACVESQKSRPVVAGVRCFLPFALLSYWYPETYYFNSFIFPNLDHYFVAADQALFGCQPSLEFSKLMPQAWFSELMYFGYFSYFFLIFGTALWCYIHRKEIFHKAIFIFVVSFYLYYIIFAIIPVIGPQFYFDPQLIEVPDGYVFCSAMRFFQYVGEKPTGAFPSSHVGITFIVIIFVYRHCRHLLRFVLPLFIILTLSTVYIKAHYLVDVIGGFISAILFYFLTSSLYRKINSDSQYL